MISNTALMGMGITSVITVIVPIVLLIVLLVKKKITGMSVMAGAVSFAILQIILRMPIVGSIPAPDAADLFGTLGYLLFLSFTAGLAETIGRFVSGRFILKENLCFKTALGFGLGTWTIEAVLMTGLNSISTFFAVLMINSGGGALIESMGEESYYAAVGILQSTDVFEFFAAGFERIMAGLIHVMLTCLVWYFIKQKKWVGLIIPLFVHMMFDFSVSVTASLLGVYMAEILVLVLGVSSLFVTLRMIPLINQPDDYQNQKKPDITRKKTDISDYLG